MFCPHCGEKIPADSNFCPNCSAPIRPQLSPAKAAAPSKRGSSKIPLFILGSAVAVVVLAAAVFVLSRLFISPVDTFISAQEDVFIKPLLSALEKQLDVYNNGEFSSDITCSASVDSADVNKYLSDSSIVLKLDTNQNSLLANGDLILMGSPVLSGTLTYDKGKLGFYLPEIDDEYYVLELSEMLDSLGIADVDLSDVKMPELSGKEWRALAEAYLDITHTVITKENLEVERREDFYLDELGGSYTGTVYTFTPTAEDVEAMIEAVADHLEKDKDLRNAIMNLVNTDAFLELFGVYGYDDMESALDEGLQDLAEELRYRAEDIGESVEESDIRWKLYMEGKELRMVSIKSRKSDEMFVFEREGTESKGCSIAFYEASDDYNTVYLQAEYTKKGDACDGDLKISDGYRNTLRIDFTMDGSKRSVLGIPYGSYSFAVPDEDIRCSLEVSEGKSGSTDHVFSLRGDDYTFGGLFTKLDVTVNTTSKSSAKKPSVKATDISDYTEQELSKLLYNLGNRVMDNLNEAAYNLR